MNPNEYEQFILRLYNAGENNTDAIKEMRSFVKEPGSLQIILDAISSHKISRITLLISLSCIPNVYITTSEDSLLRSWFNDFIFNDAESLLSDDFIALLVNVFHFTYRTDLKEGSLLIQELSNGNQSQRILAIQISLQIIEKFQKVTNIEHLISMSILPFTDEGATPQLIDSASLLLKQLLICKGSSNEIKSRILSEVNEIFPQRIFSILFNYQEEPEFISIHLLELFETFLSLKPAVFKIQDFRKFFVENSVRLFFDYTKKVNFSEMKIPVLCSIFIALRNSFSCLLYEDSLTRDFEGFTTEKRLVPQKVPILIFDNFFENAADFAKFILSENSYLRYLELVLDFWIVNHDNRLGYVNQKKFDEKVLEILDVIMQKFFTNEILEFSDQIIEIVNDRSSLLVQKLSDFACFQIDPVCERVCEFLVNELDIQNIEIAAFIIEFLSSASEKVAMNSFEQMVIIIYEYQQKVEPHSNVSFELSLIQFFQIFLKRFDSKFSEQLRDFFIRFLVDIQTTSASIEIIQEVINVLQSEWMKDECINIIASNEESFNLITQSQLVSSPSSDQPKKVTTIVFKVAFQIGFLMPNPDQVISLIDTISNRIKTDPNDSIAYLMMSGGFLSPNCKFENLYKALSNGFFQLIINRLEELISFFDGQSKGQIADTSAICTNPKIVIDILHLFNSISLCFREKSQIYLSNNVVDFSELTLRILNLTLNVSEYIDKESVDYLKIVSNISIILSNLLLNKALNFGIIEFYKNASFQETLLRVFELYLTISFDSFAQNSKMIDRYLILIKAVIGEYLTFLISIDSILIQHHLQILIFIFDLNANNFSVEAARILTSFATSLYAFEIPEIEKNCMSAMKCVIQSAFNLVIKNGSTDKISSELIYSFLMNFQSLRDEFFDEIADKIESVEMNDRMHFIFTSIKFAFYEIDEKKSFDSFRNYLGCLIKSARECGIDLSTPDLSDDDDDDKEEVNE